MCDVAAQTVAVLGTLALTSLAQSVLLWREKWLHACRCKLCTPFSNGKPKIQHNKSGAAPFLLCFPSFHPPYYAMAKWAEHALLL